MSNLKRTTITLSYENLIDFLQGKEMHLISQESEIIINPPFKGRFLTFQEIDQLRHDSELNVLNILNSLNGNKIKISE